MPDPSGVERVFLDANVLYSAAIGSDTCRFLLTLPGLVLLASDYCADEARRNLLAKANQEAAEWLAATLAAIEVVGTPPPTTWRAVARHLPPRAVSDRPVLAAALAARADTLVTGNTRDFGGLMKHPAPDLPTVITPRDFLRRGPRES